MNFITLESAQKLRGGFYTDPVVAAFLLKWIAVGKPKSILEPSCGDGIFLESIEKHNIFSIKNIVACEIEPAEAAKARNRTRLPVRVLNKDFLKWFLFEAKEKDRFDSVVGNPPFIRYQYLPDEQQILAENMFTKLGLPFTRHTNAWVPFVLASIFLLNPGGRIAMVIPSEIFHIPHAASLRRYIAAQCSRVLLIDPQEILFGDTLQGTVLLLAEKKHSPAEKSKGVGIISISNRNALSNNPEQQFQSAPYANGATIEGKWMQIFLTPSERSLISQLRGSSKIKKFSELASVDVGIVTGANKFFLVPDKTVKEFSLQRWARPMFGRSDHVKGLVFTTKDHQENSSVGLPSNFLLFQEENIEDLPHNARRYLDTGLKQQLHTRFKCRTRKRWYKVPSVYAAPVAMLKRAHHYPRLVLNVSGAYTTDTAYRIEPIGVSSSSLVFAFINSLTLLSAELEGRHYGGGVLELVPSEIERLLLPKIDASVADLKSLDRHFRKLNDELAFLPERDSYIFNKIGLAKKDQSVLHNAWLRLHDRRHRTRSAESFSSTG